MDAELQERLMRDFNRIMRDLDVQVFDWLGDKVTNGPFKGMVVPMRPVWDDGNASAKLLGSYEHELHDAIEKAISRGPKVIVNVGCAEGYYAIGLARRLVDARVYAMDLIEESRAMCGDYAARNGVEGRVRTLRGAEVPEELSIGGPGHRLYVVDCEAAELNLLDLERCGDLVRADVIIECHDFLDATISTKLMDRFFETHAIELIRPKLPPLDRYQFLVEQPAIVLMLAVTEKRPLPTLWLACWAR